MTLRIHCVHAGARMVCSRAANAKNDAKRGNLHGNKLCLDQLDPLKKRSCSIDVNTDVWKRLVF